MIAIDKLLFYIGIVIWNREAWLHLLHGQYEKVISSNDIVYTLTRRVDMTDMGIAFPRRVDFSHLSPPAPCWACRQRRMQAVLRYGDGTKLKFKPSLLAVILVGKEDTLKKIHFGNQFYSP